MNLRPVLLAAAGVGALAFSAALPFFGSGYALSMAINLLMFTALATSWAIFSGPTGYISLATVAFFGIGAYTVGVFGEALPWPLVLALSGLLSAVVAAVVGLATLRLRGVYFVIFTFGLAELIRQLVTWYEANHSGSVGRYIFLNISQEQIVWQLTALVAAVFVVGWLIQRSRTGLTLRMIGDDEVVAVHCGANTTIAFNPVISFQVLIMALLGGAGRLYGPALGVIPLVLLFEYLSANFPNYFSILLGVTFMAIVYLVPTGIAGLVESAAPKVRALLRRGSSSTVAKGGAA